MHTRRSFIGQLTGAAAALYLGGGCNTLIQQIQAWVPTAIAAFDGVIAILNPPAGSALGLAAVAVDALWKALQAVLAKYRNGSTLSDVVAALQALMNELSAVVSNLPAGVQTGIKLGLALLISTLQNFVTRLSPTAAISAQVRSITLGVQPAKDRKDFVLKWNALAIKKPDGSVLTVK